MLKIYEARTLLTEKVFREQPVVMDSKAAVEQGMAERIEEPVIPAGAEVVNIEY